MVTMTTQRMPVTNLKRYQKHFTKSPFLVFVPYTLESHHDGDQPVTASRPAGPHESIAAYPVDGAYTIFGFPTWTDAARFALANRARVFDHDVEEAKAQARLSDIAYHIWFWRTNRTGAPYGMTWDTYRKTEPGPAQELLKKVKFMGSEFAAANELVKARWPSTPC
jgi:hypothetical protein